MGSKERRERERDAVRTKILDAARTLFVANGYEGVSMRAIAEQIEYSPTLIYQYFKDKEALLQELCSEDFDRLADEFRDLLQIADPLERIRQCCRKYAQFALAYPNHYRLTFMTPLPLEPTEEELQQKKGTPEYDAYALVQLLVTMAAQEGALREPHPDIDLMTQTLWAGIHGVIALEIVFGCDKWTPWKPLPERTEAMINALGYGLFAEKP
jgi:AcrR family transcriptional regulator